MGEFQKTFPKHMDKMVDAELFAFASLINGYWIGVVAAIGWFIWSGWWR